METTPDEGIVVLNAGVVIAEDGHQLVLDEVVLHPEEDPLGRGRHLHAARLGYPVGTLHGNDGVWQAEGAK